MVEGKPIGKSKYSDVGVWIELSSVSVSIISPSASSLLSWVQLETESTSSSSSDTGGSQEVVAENVSCEGRLSCLRFCIFRPKRSNALDTVEEALGFEAEPEFGGKRGMYCSEGPHDFNLFLSFSRSLARSSS